MAAQNPAASTSQQRSSERERLDAQGRDITCKHDQQPLGVAEVFARNVQGLWQQHVSSGEKHLTKKQFDRAMQEYNLAYKCAQEEEQKVIVLLGRSKTLSRWSRHLRSIPAAQSEERCLNGQDPTLLAQLALEDAGKVAALRPSCVMPYLYRGDALLLLERYTEAQALYEEGLGLYPGNESLLAGLRRVTDVLSAEVEVSSDDSRACAGSGDGGRASVAAAAAAEGPCCARTRKRRHIGTAAGDECECSLCMKLLLEPVTTPCGHTFCKACFNRVMDHNNKCPMCRTVLHVGKDLPVSVVLKAILQRAFPEEYAARQREAVGHGGDEQGRMLLPLFVMSVLLPGEKMALNIFEPRYRLLIRRAMEGNRRFGMAQVCPSDHKKIDDVACEVEIMECHPQYDGRYYIEVVGKRRVKLLQVGEQDGYRLAQAAVLHDDPWHADVALSQMLTLAGEVEALAGEWLERIRLWYAHCRRAACVAEILERVGAKPPAPSGSRGGATSFEDISFWAARLMAISLPDMEQERMRLFKMTSTHQRLLLEKELLSRRMDSAQAGCVTM